MPDWLPILVPLAAAFAGALLAAALALALRPPTSDPALTLRLEAAAEGVRRMEERLAVVDAARGDQAELRRQLASLAAILGNKQARGALGERQLRELLADRLPAAAYSWQHTLADGLRCDALIHLPFPPGPIAVDAKFPLEGWRAWREAAGEPERSQALRRMSADIRRHIDDVARKYIRPGETAEGALLFLPAESLHADLHAALPEVVNDAARRGVHLVSPGTLWAVLGTLRALLRDLRLQDGLPRLRGDIAALVAEAAKLEARVAGMRRHYAELQGEMRRIELAAQAIAAAGARLEAEE